MKRLVAVLLPLIGAAACMDNSPTAPSTPEPNLSFGPGGFATVLVTNSNNSGPGSFRKAIELANGNALVRHIEFLPRVTTIRLHTPVAFTGPQDLAIDGNLAVVDGGLLGAGETAFLVNGGGDLTLTSLTFRNAPGNGVEVQVPGGATGTLEVVLVGLQATGNRGFGVLINDQADPSAVDGVQPPDGGSAASLEVRVFGSRFADNGYSVSDRDGLRINEGGDGDLTAVFSFLRAEDNAADGVELDERGAGNVRVESFGSLFARNGKFDPADLDDGFDIDEYNDGDLIAALVLTSADDNFEEGFDFNENNAGDFRVDMTGVGASRNGEEGIDFEEDDDFDGGGDLVTTLEWITANGNKGGDAGVKIREKGAGLADATLRHVTANDNLTSGIQVREASGGDLGAVIERVVTKGNALHGIDFQESGAGNLAGSVSYSTSSGNTGAGVNAQHSNGTGAVTLSAVDFGAGNAGGNTAGNATFTILP